MPRIVIETWIAAPPERVFDLARDVGAHAVSSSFTRERIVPPGRTSGLLEAGDLITFEGVHFGMRQRITARILEMERPRVFVDELVRSAFRRLRHVHQFEPSNGGTLMRDTLEWTSPLGILGRIADRVAIVRHMRWFVTTKQQALKEIAEGT
ncbi:MAG TPA: SRPBCC family protein [Thermoanaerobaculia bacterium]|nr:SRPBCC family protein [Thermoanaerobaculia bacterium]